VKPQGAFYVLVDISATGQNSTQFAERLLDKQKVAVRARHRFSVTTTRSGFPTRQARKTSPTA